MLDLISAKIDGFMSFDGPVEIPLNQPGFTYIRGPTGSGKSAILEAFRYLLIGDTIRDKGIVKNLVNQILKNGYDISLKYLVDNDHYFVQEIRDRSEKSGLFFTKNETEDKRGAKSPDTRKNILASLGMTPSNFHSIAFVGQEQSQVLITGTTDARAKEIVSIFGLDRYDQAIKNCDADVRESVKHRKELDSKIQEYTSELQQLEESLNLEEIPEIDEVRAAYLQTRIEVIKSKIEKIRKKQSELHETVGEAKALKQKEELIKQLQNDIAALTKELKHFDLIEKDLQELDELQETLRAKETQKTKISLTISNLKNDLAEIERLGDKCPINQETCPVDIPSVHKKERTTSCAERIQEEKDSIQGFEEEIAISKEELEQYKELNKLSLELGQKKECLEGLAFDGDVPDMDEESKRLEKCKAGIEEGSNKLEQLKGELGDIDDAKLLKSKAEEYRQKFESLLQDKKDTIVKFKKKLEKHDTEHQYIIAALTIFRKVKMYKIDLVLDLLNVNVQRTLNTISDGVYQAVFVSQKEDSKGKKILDYMDILVSDIYKTLPIGMTSGGQRAQVGLAVLLAVFESARTITNKSVTSLWLDEVLGPIDAGTVVRVFEALVQLSERLKVNSVKIISHRDLDTRLFDHIWDVRLVNGITDLEMS